MTKTDFFRLIIKVFGLYSLIVFAFSSIPKNISFVFAYADFAGIAWLILTLAVVIFLFAFLIYKSDSLIFWLKLDKGFDEERIELHNFNDLNILKLAVIIIGGITFLNSLPAFLSWTLMAFKASNGNDMINGNRIVFGSLRDYINWGTSFLNLIIGYLLVTNVNAISRFLSRKNKENTEKS